MKCGFSNCEGELVYIPTDEPFNVAYWQCPICNSTYTIDARKKRVSALSWYQFGEVMRIGDITNENVGTQPYAFIEVMGEQDLLMMPWVFTTKASNVLRLMFDDIDEVLNIEYFDLRESIPIYPMNDSQATQIVEFVRANEDKKCFIIHCAAGLSRSAGIAKFINEYFGGDDWWYKQCNPHAHPNQRITNMLRREYDRIVPRTDTGSPEGGCVA